MNEVKDDVLKKVTGGSLSEDFAAVIWNAVGTVLIPLLDGLKTDSTYGYAAGCILQVIQNKGAGSYSVAQVASSCELLMGAASIKANELAIEYLQAISDFVKGV